MYLLWDRARRLLGAHAHKYRAKLRETIQLLEQLLFIYLNITHTAQYE